MIDTQPLVILREIDRTGSLTLAADKLCLTQSAVSHAIRRFEERHGMKLWARDGRNLRLTPAGDYLLSVANRVLPQLEHSAKVLEDFADGRRGTLRIGVECHPCQSWLMRVVDQFLHQWPDVELDVTSAFQFGGLAALLGHEIDLLVTPDPVERRGLQYEPVFNYELVLAVSDTHTLAQKSFVVPKDLSRETLITYPVAKERLDIYTQFFAPAHAMPRRHRTVETTALMLLLVATGQAVSATPDWLVQDMSDICGVRLGSGISKSINLGFRDDQNSKPLKRFVELASSIDIEDMKTGSR